MPQFRMGDDKTYQMGDNQDHNYGISEDLWTDGNHVSASHLLGIIH